MRLGLFVGLLVITVLISTFFIPVGPEHLPVPSGTIPAPPTSASCLTLRYSGYSRSERLPHKLKLRADTTSWVLGRKTYRAVGDGDWSWSYAYWSYAGPDSIDVTAHHQPTLRLSRLPEGGVRRGRGVPYLDGPLFFALFFPVQGPFHVWSEGVSCSSI